MEAPAEAVRRLHRLNHMARLAWFGHERHPDDEGELNHGAFALLQLYPRHLEDETMYEPWSDKGPVYGASWDANRYAPVWLANFTKEEVSEKHGFPFLEKVKRWMRPMTERVMESAKQRGLDEESRIRDPAEEAGDRLWHDGQRSTTNSKNIVASKFLTAEDKYVLSGDKSAANSWENKFMPVRPEGGISASSARSSLVVWASIRARPTRTSMGHPPTRGSG